MLLAVLAALFSMSCATKATILIAGGAGYIGSHVAEEFLTAGYNVVIYDDLSTGHRGAVDALKAHWASLNEGTTFKFVHGDVRSTDKLAAVLINEGVSAVVHLCAFSLVGESVTEPLKYYENNVGGAISLLRAMRLANVSRIVLSSTAAVYGEPDEVPIQEDARTEPTNPYGETKLAIEKMLRWQTRADSRFHAISLRYFNVAGSSSRLLIGEDHQPETHLVPNIFLSVLKQGDLQVFGNDYPTRDGTCIRDYIDVRDLSHAHLLAVERLLRQEAEKKSAADLEVFNLGSEAGYSVLEIIRTCEEVTGRQIKYRISGRRAGDPASLVASSSRAQKVLGWTRSYTLKDMIASAWKWHRGNSNGFSSRSAEKMEL